jgi:hypothetical protein
MIPQFKLSQTRSSFNLLFLIFQYNNDIASAKNMKQSWSVADITCILMKMFCLCSINCTLSAIAKDKLNAKY